MTEVTHTTRQEFPHGWDSDDPLPPVVEVELPPEVAQRAADIEVIMSLDPFKADLAHQAQAIKALARLLGVIR